MLNFHSISGWKHSTSSNKRQRYLIIVWLPANYLFYVKIHVNVNKNCERGKRKKLECGKAHFTSKWKMLFLIDEAAIGLLFNLAIVHFMSQQMWNSLNSYHILLRLILITCKKRAVNNLLETAGELKASIDPDSVVFLTQFWPTCGMVNFVSERLISSW